MPTIPDPDPLAWQLVQDPMTKEIIVVPANEYPIGVAAELPYALKAAFDLRNEDPEYNRARRTGRTW